jgi:hypothetical protein
MNLTHNKFIVYMKMNLAPDKFIVYENEFNSQQKL